MNPAVFWEFRNAHLISLLSLLPLHNTYIFTLTSLIHGIILVHDNGGEENSVLI